MKQGRKLTELAAELEHQQTQKHDYKVPTTQLTVTPEAKVQINGFGEFAPTEIFHEQLAGHLEIPKKYYDRMKTEAPELLADNANHWLHTKPETRMVRTFSPDRPTARAFLSNRYRAIDNFDVAQAVLPVLVEHGSGLRVESCDVTDRRLYFKAVSERITGAVKGQPVQAMISVSNSELGLGAFRVEFGLFILACLNGAIMPEEGMKKYHVGRAGDEFSAAYEVLSDPTREADDRALMMKMTDVVRAAFNEERFQQLIAGVQLTAQHRIEKDPNAAIALVVEEYALPEKSEGGILKHLISGGDLTQWGLSNAVTAYAQEAEHDYERATELEKIGGKLLTLRGAAWERFAQAA